jgi:hypothetical protein
VRHVIISTANRGKVRPPEPVSSEDQEAINARIEQEWRWAKGERDPQLSAREIWMEEKGRHTPRGRE